MSERFRLCFLFDSPIRSLCIIQSILSKQPRIKFISIYFCALLVDLSNKVAEKIASLFYFFWQQIHAPTRAVFFQRRARRPRIVVDLGHWELNLIQRWRAEGMVGFSLVFHLFCKVSSDYRWIKQ